jgi:hypothetical protein
MKIKKNFLYFSFAIRHHKDKRLEAKNFVAASAGSHVYFVLLVLL